ncbi:MAG TPA: glycosyltransferase family 1 protein [Xanthomonadaceae bacterium]|nr:glycosyltransferase family 1 protein [Xanthomonadaceae bacterium]
MALHVADITMLYAPASGGVRTFLEAKADWLRSRPGMRHSLLVPGNGFACDGEIHTLPAPRIPFGKGYRFPALRKAWVEKLVSLKPDLIEAQDPYVPGWAAVEAGEKLGVPVIGYYHSDLPRLVGSRVGHWTDIILDTYIARLYRRFDRVLAPSQVMAEKLERLRVPNVHVQPLGVDLQRFRHSRKDMQMRQRLGIDPNARLLVFAGRGSHEKNIPLLLKMMGELGDRYRLLLVGSHMPTRYPDNVHVIDHFVPKDELAGMLAACDALVHAGDRETFGLVVLEAMAAGLPVIGVDRGAVAELVTPECGCLARAGDAKSFAAAVREVFDGDPVAMGRNGRHRVEAAYGWNGVMAGLLNHYAALTDVVVADEILLEELSRVAAAG